MISNRAEIIAISNQKGGVGKTSTANALAARLHDLGKSVLAIDMDPQGNLSASINAEYDSGTILDVMRGKVPAKEAVQHKEPFDIIPANILLAGYEQELISSNFGRDIRLKKGIAPLLSEYEYIIIDTAPSLGMLTINSLVAADQVIVPATAEYFATKGLEDFVDTIRNVQEYCGNPYLRIAGILFTLVDTRTINGQAIRAATDEYAKSIGTKTYKIVIRKAIAMGESQTNRMDIFSYSPKSTVARDYAAFVNEFLADRDRSE